MSIQLTFKIILESDYHVSDGQRVGLSVDSALLRDHNQSPVMRGTALAGLLRDGFRDLQATVKQSGLTPKQALDADVQKRIFGEPGIPKQWFFSSTRLLIDKEKEKKERWGGNDVWRVRINPRTRRSDPQKLFLEETGDGRLRFTFTATCESSRDDHRADAAALVAAASMVRHLGSGRRRGRGQCRLELIGADDFIVRRDNESWQDAGLRAFKEHWLEGKTLSAATSPASASSSGSEATDDGSAKRFRMIARLEEPLVVAKKSQVANAFETLDMIPGTVMLGAIASRAACQLDLTDVDAADHALFRQMFLRGGITVSGLLPAEAESKLYPAIAAPRSWAQCELHPQFGKETPVTPHPVNDLSKQSDPGKCTQCGSKLKEVEGYIKVSTRRAYHEVKTRDEMHITMQRKTGRVKEGDLFTYQAIQGGQWFVGELRCAPGMWSKLQAYAGLRADGVITLRLGKATRRGYGLTRLVLSEMKDDDPSVWVMRKLDKRLPDKAQNGSFDLSMLFLTDAILLDRWGRFQQGMDRETLARILGVDEGKIGEDIRPFLSSRIIDNFNTHRQIPRWRDEAIVAGSMVRFTLHVESREEAIAILETVEKNGIGLRRHEGFGRIAFNHPVFENKPEVGGIKLRGVTKRLESMADAHQGVSAVVQTILGEDDFAGRWEEILDDSWEENEKTWQSLKDEFEPLARLIYLYRRRSLDDLKTWLSGNGRQLGDEQNLWGQRKLVGRDKEPKLDKTGVKLINGLLDSLAQRPESYHAIGLTMLAERLGAQLDENRENRQKEGKSDA